MGKNGDYQTPSSGKPSFWKRLLQFAIPLLFLILGGALFLERFLGDRRLKEASERSASERKALEVLASNRSIDIQRRDIGLFALPLAWSVRRELMHGNYDQIDEYFSELIRLKGFALFMLIEPDGIVRISTDRKLQGSSFSVLYPGMELGVQKPVSFGLRDGRSLFILPVMGLSGRLGTLAFVYSYQPLQLSGQAQK